MSASGGKKRAEKNKPSESEVREPAPRRATLERNTKETRIALELSLDGEGQHEIQTGLGIFDHLLSALVFHARFDLRLRCEGDLHVDDHHTVEDCALALGAALSSALGQRAGIVRFGWAYAPLDEALARAVVDLSGRPAAVISLGLQRSAIGPLACENIEHFFASFAQAAGMALHLDVLRGANDHHQAEAAAKALALALRQAVARGGGAAVPSTKGVL